MSESSQARRGGGRAARIAARATGLPPVNPAPPGGRGGRYRPLSDAQVQAIIETAIRILAEIGMGDAPPVLVKAATARGAIHRNGRLFFPHPLIDEIIAGAVRAFTFHGRDPAHDIVVGGERVYFGTGGAAVQTRDLETGHYRPATLADLYAFARIADACPNLAWFTRCCIATDIADPMLQEINIAYALLAGTQKPVGISFTTAGVVDHVIDMFDLAMGGPGAFAAKPCLKAHVSPVISPLKYGEDAVEVTLACIRRGVPVNAIIAAQSGATAPAQLAAMLAQSTAETLAGLIMVNLFAPGHPVIFSNWPFVIDLRTGAFAGSGGEISLMNAAAAQIGRALNLPSGVAAAMADAKAVDAQMGAEKAASALAVGLAGANMIYESAGMMAALMGASFEAMVADDEMLGQVHRMIRGIEVDPAALDFDGIAAAVAGPGHFLGADATMAAMQRDYLYPRLGDRQAIREWQAAGGSDMATRARDRAREILATPAPDFIGPADDAIRARFDIRLPKR